MAPPPPPPPATDPGAIYDTMAALQDQLARLMERRKAKRDAARQYKREDLKAAADQCLKEAARYAVDIERLESMRVNLQMVVERNEQSELNKSLVDTMTQLQKQIRAQV